MADQAKMPRTAADALAQWDAGEPVPAFRIESEGAEQVQIYAVAFDVIRMRTVKPGDTMPAAESHSLTDRENDVALAIAQSALSRGWAKIVEEHTASGHIPTIVVQKPKAVSA